MQNPTKIYRMVMRSLEWRIAELGWTMRECDDRSGLQDGFTAKMLHPDTPSGRQARWDMVDLLIRALYPDGYELAILPISSGKMGADAKRFVEQANRAASIALPRNLRFKLARELGRRGALQRAKVLTPERRSAIARQAAQARWRS